MGRTPPPMSRAPFTTEEAVNGLARLARAGALHPSQLGEMRMRQPVDARLNRALPSDGTLDREIERMDFLLGTIRKALSETRAVFAGREVAEA